LLLILVAGGVKQTVVGTVLDIFIGSLLTHEDVQSSSYWTRLAITDRAGRILYCYLQTWGSTSPLDADEVAAAIRAALRDVPGR